MLIEKSQELIELSQRKVSLKNYADNLQGFQSREEQINNFITEIQTIMQAVKAFREKGISNITVDKKLDDLLNFIIHAENDFRENPDWIIDNKHFDAKIFKKGIDNITQTLKQQLSTDWQIYLSQNMPSTNQEMLNLLSKVQAFSHHVQRIRNLDQEIKRVNYPKNIHQLELTQMQITELKQCWESLSSDDVPEAVLNLLRAAANQGASLNLLTPEVLDWVNTYGMADSLKIRLI
ncbi:MAG: hypothetical protein HCA25_22155 [Dolichospermum sp. DET50]|nr:hypothetical protein [Dolichospermum sp. DET66]MBS3034875.1 hypothetical protein [Dolichospermum sp. DET67]MBS3040078.1 hypothetical protein [Dolichospermum sp. DET50]QSX67255.1 MAG: hypothetical protein EZY12_21415 [Dolichospermum sp. DET69]